MAQSVEYVSVPMCAFSGGESPSWARPGRVPVTACDVAQEGTQWGQPALTTGSLQVRSFWTPFLLLPPSSTALRRTDTVLYCTVQPRLQPAQVLFVPACGCAGVECQVRVGQPARPVPGRSARAGGGRLRSPVLGGRQHAHLPAAPTAPSRYASMLISRSTDGTLKVRQHAHLPQHRRHSQGTPACSSPAAPTAPSRYASMLISRSTDGTLKVRQHAHLPQHRRHPRR